MSRRNSLKHTQVAMKFNREPPPKWYMNPHRSLMSTKRSLKIPSSSEYIYIYKHKNKQVSNFHPPSGSEYTLYRYTYIYIYINIYNRST